MKRACGLVFVPEWSLIYYLKILKSEIVILKIEVAYCKRATILPYHNCRESPPPKMWDPFSHLNGEKSDVLNQAYYHSKTSEQCNVTTPDSFGVT